MGLRERLARYISPSTPAERFNLGQYPAFVQDYYSQFGYAGGLYPLGLNQSMTTWQKTEEISGTLPNYMMALRKSPPAFAAQMVRASILSMARFTFRIRPGGSSSRRVFGNKELLLLEQPWTNATTGELITRMEWSAGLAGNAYVVRQPDRLRVLRADWTAIVYGSQAEPDDPKGAVDGEVLGYAYRNGGFSGNNKNEVHVFLPEQVAHWSPLPDPMSPGLGMSWITPALRDIQGDNAALEHKLAYFSNGATPNLVIKGIPGATPAAFEEWVDKFGAKHEGAVNAFKTIYLSAGADATVVGSNLQQLDLSAITAHGETRVSYLSRVPAAILGIADGLKGSSLNAGNYAQARRNLSDSWVYPTLQDLCGALASIINVPAGAELWFDVADIPLLREDAQDAAAIELVKQQAVVAYVNGGFTPESAIAAVLGQDITLLKHTGLVSVQLQPPGTIAGPAPSTPTPAAPTDAPAAKAGRAQEFTEARGLLDAARDLMQAAPPHNITVQPADVSIPVTVNVQPAEVQMQPADVTVNVQPANAPDVTIQGDTINVQPADVSVPVTVTTPEVQVQPADITIEGATITVQPADVSVPVTVEAPITVQPPHVQVDAPVTVNMPTEEPSQGVEVIYDGDKVIGTRPRNKGKR